MGTHGSPEEFRREAVELQSQLRSAIDYVTRRTAEVLSKRDIIRCLKRFLAREIYQRVMTDHRSRLALADTP